MTSGGAERPRHWSLVLALAVVFASATMLAVAAASPAAAPGGRLKLSVSPLTTELEANRGERVETTMSVTNYSDTAVSLVSEAVDFSAVGTHGEPQFMKADASPWSMSTWIHSTPANVVLAPGGSVLATVSIDVPLNAEPGGHYAAALYSTTPGDGTQMSAVASVGMLILLKVNGEVAEAASARVIAPHLAEPAPVDVGLLFTNEGNVHLKPQGEISITRFGESSSVRLKIAEENVLPQSTRAFGAEWTAVPTFGFFWVQGTMRYGGVPETLQTSRHVLVIAPWRTILVVGGAFALGAIGATILNRRRKKPGVG